MFHLLRMDLYRIKRSKSVYVCLGVLLIGTVMSMGLFWLLTSPQGQEIALRIGMLEVDERQEVASILDGMDILAMFRQICMDGGTYSLIFGIWVMLFVCMDFQSGFIKNIMALHQNRWGYIGSKLMAAGIVDFCYLVLYLLCVMLMNRLLGNMVSASEWGDLLFYLGWAWLLTAAFAALIILVCVLTRSVAAGALAAVFLGSGMVVSILYGLLDMFHMAGWLEHTIYMTLAMGPGHYGSVQDLYVYVTGAAFLLLYAVGAGIVLERQDI